MSNDPDSNREGFSFRVVLTLVGLVLLVWVASLATVAKFFHSWSDRAAFGESFGAVNALFSGLALGGVIVAILLQRQDLQLQRTELELTRKELQRTAVSQEETKRLTELGFLMGLAPRFSERRASFNEAWNTLRQIKEHVTDPSDARWEPAVKALEQYYAAATFLYQIAVLTNRGILNAESVYLLYYDYILEHPNSLFKTLAEWCGTGNELAANYSWHDVARMTGEVAPFLQTLEDLHRGSGGEVFEWVLIGVQKVHDDVMQRGDPYERSKH